MTCLLCSLILAMTNEEPVKGWQVLGHCLLPWFGVILQTECHPIL